MVIQTELFLCYCDGDLASARAQASDRVAVIPTAGNQLLGWPANTTKVRERVREILTRLKLGLGSSFLYLMIASRSWKFYVAKSVLGTLLLWHYISWSLS